MAITHFVHPFIFLVDLGCFCHLIIVNDAAMNIRVTSTVSVQVLLQVKFFGENT